MKKNLQFPKGFFPVSAEVMIVTNISTEPFKLWLSQGVRSTDGEGKAGERLMPRPAPVSLHAFACTLQWSADCDHCRRMCRQSASQEGPTVLDAPTADFSFVLGGSC